MKAVYQIEGRPMAIVTFVNGVDVEALAPTVVPDKVKYWLVEDSVIEDLYASQGDLRDAWVIKTDEKHSGVGRFKDV